MLLKKIPLILFLLFLLDACRDIDSCDADDNSDEMLIRFFNIDTTSESQNVPFRFRAAETNVEFVFTNDSVPSIDGEDTTWIRVGNAILLPLNSEFDTIQYYFLSDTLNDTLTLKYSRTFSLFDPECTPTIAFTDLDTIHHTFDSLVISNPVINDQVTTNLSIYL